MSKTFDCFYVNDELDLLEFRLGYLWEVVDEFVVVEAGLTFSGQPKPLHVRAALAGPLARYAGKLTVLTAALPVEAEDAWEREYAQRTFMRTSILARADAEDVLLVGDVDEIPFRATVLQLATGLDRPARLGMAHANYFVNWVMKAPWDLGPMAFHPHMVGDPAVAHLLGDASLNERSREGHVLHGAGWHLSFLGGADRIRRKLAAYSHQDFAIESNLRPGHLERCMRYGSAFTGFHRLRKQPPGQLDDLQRALLLAHPEFFSFSQRSSPIRAGIYNGYCRALLTGALPGRAGALIARRPWLVTSVLAPYFGGKDLRRRVGHALGSS